MSMYSKDKNHRLTLRLNDDQFAFLLQNAESLDVAPSEFLRMVINTSMYASRQMVGNEKLHEAVEDIVIKTHEEIEEAKGRENDEANKHNQL